MSEPVYDEGRSKPTPSIPQVQDMSAERADPRPAAQRRIRPRLVVKRLWSGGVGIAVVAALIVVVGVLLARGVLGIPVLGATEAGAYGTVSTTGYAVGAAVVALVATGVFHLMLLFLPRPVAFFNWVGVLLTAVAVLLPFTTGAAVASQLATAGINLVTGLCVVMMLGSVGASSVVVEPAGPPRGRAPQ